MRVNHGADSAVRPPTIYTVLSLAEENAKSDIRATPLADGIEVGPQGFTTAEIKGMDRIFHSVTGLELDAA